jgi:hypothetical protein
MFESSGEIRMSEAPVPGGGRRSRDDWIELAIAQLKARGPSALTVESL